MMCTHCPITTLRLTGPISLKWSSTFMWTCWCFCALFFVRLTCKIASNLWYILRTDFVEKAQAYCITVCAPSVINSRRCLFTRCCGLWPYILRLILWRKYVFPPFFPCVGLRSRIYWTSRHHDEYVYFQDCPVALLLTMAPFLKVLDYIQDPSSTVISPYIFVFGLFAGPLIETTVYQRGKAPSSTIANSLLIVFDNAFRITCRIRYV